LGVRKENTSGPASAQASSEANRTTESAASSSEVGTTVVIVSVTETLRGYKGTRSTEEERKKKVLVTKKTPY